MTTPILGLPELLAGQADAYLQHNEALRGLEFFAAGVVESRTLTAPPSNPIEGRGYIPAAPATGDWAAKENQLLLYLNGGWRVFAPREGFRVWVTEEDSGYRYDGSAWVEDVGGSGGTGAHTIADETSDLPARSKLAFVGAGATATDDAAGDRTVVTIPGGGGGGLPAVYSTFPEAIDDPITALEAGPSLIQINGGFVKKQYGAVVPSGAENGAAGFLLNYGSNTCFIGLLYRVISATPNDAITVYVRSDGTKDNAILVQLYPNLSRVRFFNVSNGAVSDPNQNVFCSFQTNSFRDANIICEPESITIYSKADGYRLTYATNLHQNNSHFGIFSQPELGNSVRSFCIDPWPTLVRV